MGAVVSGMATGREVQKTVTVAGVAALGGAGARAAAEGAERALGPAGVGLAVAGEGLRVQGEIERGADPGGSLAAAGGRMLTNTEGALIGASIGTMIEPGLGTLIGSGVGAVVTDMSGVSEGVGENLRQGWERGPEPAGFDCSATMTGCSP